MFHVMLGGGNWVLVGFRLALFLLFISPLFSLPIKTDDSGVSWITSFCQEQQNQFFCEVERAFIEDGCKYLLVEGGKEGGSSEMAQIWTDPLILPTHLARKQSTFTACGHTSSISRSRWTSSWTINRMVRKKEDQPGLIICRVSDSHYLPTAEDEGADQGEYQENAELLYGMIHARYIITMHGMETMVREDPALTLLETRGGKKSAFYWSHPFSYPFVFISSTQSRKYERKDFGECPRMMCEGQAVVPVR